MLDLTLYAAVSSLLAVPGITSESASSEESADSDGRIEYLVERQRNYTLTGDKGRGAAELVTKPLSRWSNPISGANGAIFVWTLDGRPAALTKVHVNDRKRNYVESTIALMDGLSMTQGDRKVWDPSEPTLEVITASDLQGPANLKSARLLQMRLLAESLDVQDSWGEVDSGGGEGEIYQLRLMPRPIYRYAAAESGVLDGAVFGFAQGTNIEAIALVEAIETANSTKWRIGFSRLTRYAIKVRRDGEIVYDVPRLNWTRNTASYRYLWQQPRPYPFDEAPRPEN